MRCLDLTGRRSGRLTVLGFSHVDKIKYTMWFVRRIAERNLCRARHGIDKRQHWRKVDASNTKSRTRSTDISRKRRRAMGIANLSIVKAMMARCYNPHNASWKTYGGCGIKSACVGTTFRLPRGYGRALLQGRRSTVLIAAGHYEPSTVEWKTLLAISSYFTSEFRL